MLLIALREDGGLTLTSDDAQAENVRVADCFEPEHEDEETGDIYEDLSVPYEVVRAWSEAPFENGKLTVEFAPEFTKDILEALVSEFPAADEVLELLAKKEQPERELKPKPKRTGGDRL